MTEIADDGPIPPDLAGRRAVVTGGAHGIGKAIAARLVRCGCEVIVVDTDRAALEAMSQEVTCLPMVGDLSSPEAAALAEDLIRTHGPVQLIVDNVGISTDHGFLDLGEDHFDKVFRANLRGPWFFTKRLVRELTESGLPGSIVFLSSLHDTFVRGNPHYSSSKAAVVMLAKELAHELAPQGIRVNVVAPGAIRTPSNPAPPDDPAGRRFVPMGRTGEPDDVARIVVVLLSDTWAGYVTGAEVRVDGGLGLHSWITDQEPLRGGPGH